MHMTDLLPSETWKELEQEIFERFGLNARVYDNKGFTFTGHTTWCNRVCPAIKEKKEALAAICSVAHQFMANEATCSRGPVIDECDAGLLKICVPVFAGEELVGIVGGCGLTMDESEVDTFMIEKAASIPEETVIELTSDLGSMSRSKAEEVVSYLEKRLAVLLREKY